VRSLLQDPSYRNAAGAAGTRLRSLNGAIAAADELESLIKVPKGAGAVGSMIVPGFVRRNETLRL